MGDNNLNVQVANLRRVFGVDAVITIPGRSLRFGLDIMPERSFALPFSGRPSVVILPFTDLGADRDLA